MATRVGRLAQRVSGAVRLPGLPRAAPHGSQATETDSWWILRSVSEPGAFAVIFERHHPAIRRYLTSRLGWDTGEELTGEAFLRAFEQRNRFDLSQECARGWLLGIAANLCRMELRRLERESRAYRRSLVLVRDDGMAADVARRIDAAREWRRLGLRNIIRALPEGEVGVLALFAISDLSYREIAQALDIPMGTVKSRLSRVRATIRDRAQITTSAAALMTNLGA